MTTVTVNLPAITFFLALVLNTTKWAQINLSVRALYLQDQVEAVDKWLRTRKLALYAVMSTVSAIVVLTVVIYYSRGCG